MNIKMLRYIFLLLYISLSLSQNLIAGTITTIDGMYSNEDTPFFDENGNKRFLTEFDGKTILLTFWATWCPSCVEEMPELDILQKDFRKLPFEVLAISQDNQGIDVIKEHFKNNDIRYLKIYHDNRNQLFLAYAVVGLPTSFLINKDGKVVVSFTGPIKWHEDEIRKILLSYIPGDYPEPRNSHKNTGLN